MKWIPYKPGDPRAIKLLEDFGAVTHSICRVTVNGEDRFECYRNPGAKRSQFMDSFATADEAKRACVEDLKQRRAA